MKNARTIVFFCTNLFMLLLLLIIVVDKTAGYNDKYDNFDVDNVLKNNRVMTYYIKCLMEKGPCNNEGKDLKSEYIIFILILFISIVKKTCSIKLFFIFKFY